MTVLLSILHVIICVILIAAILLQSGKAADLAGAFGGAGSATAFGPRGTASLMAKITTTSAIHFMVTSIGLWLSSAPKKGSRMTGADQSKPAAAATEKKESKAAGTQTAGQPAGSEAQKPPVKTPDQPK